MSLGATVPGTDDGNCGWTGDNASAAMHQALCNSVDAGVFYAVAAGNDSHDFATNVPAAFDQALTVAAMADFDGKPGSTGVSSCSPDNQDDTAADFSNWATTANDEGHTIAAPGVCIRSTWKKGRYKTLSGTSMATPHITGTAALCIASGKCGGTPADIMSKLRTDAENQSNLTTIPYYGFKGDPNTTGATIYYGFLDYAGGY